MSLLRSLEFSLARPIGKNIAPLARRRQQAFMLRQGLHCLAVLVAMPIILAWHGVPSLAEALVFVTMLLPLSALVFVALTDVLSLAQALVSIGLCFLSVALAAAGAGMGPVGAALFIASAEAFITFDPRLIGACCIASAAALLGISILHGAIVPAPGMTGGMDFFSLGGGLLYGGALMFHSVRLRSAEWHASPLEAEKNHRHLLAAIGRLGDLAVLHDRSGAAQALNQQGERLLGAASNGLMGRDFFDHIHVLDRPAFLQAIAEATFGDEACRILIRLRGLADESSSPEPYFRWFDVSMNRILLPLKSKDDATGDDKRGNEEAIIAVYRDITGLKQHEQDLELERAAAEAANQAKDRFLANMSHELRTPLNAIIGFSEILSHPQLCPRDPLKQQEYATIIHGSGEHLLNVVNSILDMSKIHSGAFPLQPQPLALSALIDSCCDMVRPGTDAKRIELVQVYADPIDEIMADRQACKQILLNLLSNAVKFTPPMGRITIEVNSLGHSVQIIVRDTGIGIGSGDLVRLGEPFFQAIAGQERPSEGTGLGLSIVRGLIDLHGGELIIESEPEKGTSMIVRLPRDGREEKPSHQDQRIEIKNHRGQAVDIAVLKEAKVKKIA